MVRQPEELGDQLQEHRAFPLHRSRHGCISSVTVTLERKTNSCLRKRGFIIRLFLVVPYNLGMCVRFRCPFVVRCSRAWSATMRKDVISSAYLRVRHLEVEGRRCSTQMWRYTPVYRRKASSSRYSLGRGRQLEWYPESLSEGGTTQLFWIRIYRSVLWVWRCKESGTFDEFEKPKYADV
jgi:hypothetical protein